jgi:TonB family protein
MNFIIDFVLTYPRSDIDAFPPDLFEFLPDTLNNFLARAAVCTVLSIPAVGHSADVPPAAPEATPASPAPTATPPGFPVIPAWTTDREPTRKPVLFDALMSAAKESKARFGKIKEPLKALDAYETFEFSDETKAKLIQVFGNSKPLAIVHGKSSKARQNYRASVAAHRFEDSNGTVFDWSEFALDMAFENKGRSLVSHGAWPTLDVTFKDGKVSSHDMVFFGKQKLGPSGQWLGNAGATVASIAFEYQGKPALKLENLRVQADNTQHGKLIDVKQDVSVRSIEVAGERIENFHMGLRINNLDAKQIEAMRDASERGTANTPAEQRAANLLPQFVSFAKESVKNGLTIDLDDLSLRYHGQLAQLKGKISARKVTDSDFESFAAFAKTIVARFELNVPMALVHDIAKVIARKASVTRPDAPLSDAAADQLGQSMYDVIIGKSVGQGYARVDGDVLRTTIEFVDGQLRLNGKAVEFPATPPKPSVDSAAASYQLHGDCPPIVYPKEALRNEQAGTAKVRFQVGADGLVTNATLSESSHWPVLDAASLDITKACKFKLDPAQVAKPELWHERKFVWKLDSGPAAPRPQTPPVPAPATK